MLWRRSRPIPASFQWWWFICVTLGSLVKDNKLRRFWSMNKFLAWNFLLSAIFSLGTNNMVQLEIKFPTDSSSSSNNTGTRTTGRLKWLDGSERDLISASIQNSRSLSSRRLDWENALKKAKAHPVSCQRWFIWMVIKGNKLKRFWSMKKFLAWTFSSLCHFIPFVINNMIQLEFESSTDSSSSSTILELEPVGESNGWMPMREI